MNRPNNNKEEEEGGRGRETEKVVPMRSARDNNPKINKKKIGKKIATTTNKNTEIQSK